MFSLVSRVTIDKKRDLKVEIRMDLLDLSSEDPDQDDSTGVQVSKDRTYTCKRSFPARMTDCTYHKIEFANVLLSKK